MGTCSTPATIATGSNKASFSILQVDNGFVVYKNGPTYATFVALDKESVIKILTEQL